MKIVYYMNSFGDFSIRRTNNPRITSIKEILHPGIYIETTTGVLLKENEIFFYEEEKALGRVE
jgi:hypothetical protein